MPVYPAVCPTRPGRSVRLRPDRAFPRGRHARAGVRPQSIPSHRAQQYSFLCDTGRRTGGDGVSARTPGKSFLLVAESILTKVAELLASSIWKYTIVVHACVRAFEGQIHPLGRNGSYSRPASTCTRTRARTCTRTPQSTAGPSAHQPQSRVCTRTDSRASRWTPAKPFFLTVARPPRRKDHQQPGVVAHTNAHASPTEAREGTDARTPTGALPRASAQNSSQRIPTGTLPRVFWRPQASPKRSVRFFPLCHPPIY